MTQPLQEFHLSITPLAGGDRYLLRTDRVADGVPLAEEQVDWPVADWLVQTQQVMDDPLLGLLRAGDGIEQTLNRLGSDLYDSLFCGRVRDSWLIAQGVAQNRQAALQLRLGLKGDRLPRLPWEALYADGRPLTTGTDVTFARYRSQFGSTGVLGSSGLTDRLRSARRRDRLRILVAIAAPSDQAALALHHEVDRLERELVAAVDLGPSLGLAHRPVQIDTLEQPDRAQLTQALEQGDYQVFHYAGHSSLGAEGGSLYLVNERTGLTETLSGDDLAGLLVNNGVLLAFFNSCQGSYSAKGGSGREGEAIAADNLAAALVKRGVPGVLAMAEQIPDDVALTLTQLFYRNLRADYPIALSLGRVRQGLVSTYGSGQFYWALPILYLHPDFDGLLFEPTPNLAQAELGLSDDRLSDDLDDARSPVTGPISDQTPPIAPSTTGLPDELAIAPSQTSQRTDQSDQSQPPTNLAGTPLNTTNATTTASSQVMRTGVPAAGSSGSAPADLSSSIASAQSARWSQSVAAVPKRWIAAGLVTTALGGAGLFFSQSHRSTPITPASSSVLAPGNTIDLKTADSLSLQNWAIGQFQQGNLAAGAAAIEALIEPRRNALTAAVTALQALPTDRDTPESLFLRGRVAWQLARAKDPNYSAADALRFWQLASEKNPDSPALHVAIGFALYHQGDLNAAEASWQRGLTLANQQAATIASPALPGTSASLAQLTTRESLNAQAGLALVAWRRAQATSDLNQRLPLLQQATQYKQTIVNAAGSDFLPEALAQTWLWPEGAIADWRSVLTLSPSTTP